VFACLSAGFGWTYENEDGTRSPIVLVDVHRYAGMLAGKAVRDGRPWSRPLGEFEALSVDGVEWKPVFELCSLIPWEEHVQQHAVPLPVDGGSDN
jgi:hypothetical protein